ncbi:sulfate reduction electron transfer complex DsrMKJOP subunit DsrO [Desulfatitalea alkaliphila]|uniref:4Fe-4S dicluster domain-containing protein n=1 Tax=Desulfatitalea alkaliphila TaxID=2929485 RepID=A0AA41UJ81_9BACT|nr:4Fe-4S dicluster domain-containing protein [Desulfatitalea alkaliphila]MCJ8499096.1 4Fe-4S dicluster domain-containing protein [Desulfatitalea alkaliphila]
MESSRRRFMKMAGIAAVGLSAQPVIKAVAAAPTNGTHSLQKGPKALIGSQWAMVIDTRRFKTERDVAPLIEACHKTHNVPHFSDRRHEIKWLWETHFHNAFPDIVNPHMSEEAEHRPYLVLCNHCENPPCVRACPTKATFKRQSDGIVVMDMHRCIGCRFCMAACPYGARSFNFRDPRQGLVEKEMNPQYPTRMKGVVEKCNFCSERLSEGLMPACVEASKGAIVFGDLRDPNSEVRRVLRENFTIRRKSGLGTEPCVYYIV